MNIKFVVNDYILVWNLLFRASISETVHKLKQKLWMNYKKEYNDTYKDKNLMLKDIKKDTVEMTYNFDDTELELSKILDSSARFPICEE